jgi:outer membrane receptor for ferrienterochelin and colicins
MKWCRMFVVLLACVQFLTGVKAYGQEVDTLSTYHGDDVVVTATRSNHILKNVPIETNLISQQEIENAGIQTVADAARWVPGLNISGGAPFGASRRFTSLMRGLPAQYTLVLIDGKRTKSEHIHTGNNLNLIPVNMVERLEVVKGPSSALYGSDAMGGVINIITKSAPEKASLGADLRYGSFDTRNATLSHGNQIGRIGYYLSGRQENTDGINKNRYKQQNLMAKIAYDATEKDELGFNSRMYANTYMNSGKEAKDNAVDLIGHWKHRLNETSTFNVETSLSRFTGSAKDAVNNTAETDVLYQGLLKQRHYLSLGLEIRRESFKRLATAQHSESIFATFLQDELQATDWLDIVASLRADMHPKAGNVLSPKIGTLWKLTDRTGLRASVGRGFRAPSLQDLYEYHYLHGTYWRDGNENLKPEYSWSTTLGLQQEISTGFQWRVTGFRNDFRNMIAALATGELEDDGLAIVQRQNIKTALTRGIEVETRHQIHDFQLTLGYTWLDTEDDEGKVLSYNPKHMVTSRLSYYSQSSGFGAWLSLEDALQRYYQDKSGQVQTLDDYLLLNVNLHQRVSRHIKISLSIGNVLDEKFASYEEGKTQAGFGRSFMGGVEFNL